LKRNGSRSQSKVKVYPEKRNVPKVSKTTNVLTGTNEESIRKREPQRWKSWLNANWAGVVISFLALAVAVYSAYATRKHNRLSVRPHIGISFVANDKGAGWVLSSNGAGPAIVNSFEVTVDGKPIQSWDAVLNALGIDLQGRKYEFSIPTPGTNLPPRVDGTATLLWVDPAARTALLKNFARVQLKLVYCSLYDECWERASSQTHLEPIPVPKRKPTVTFGASQGRIEAFPPVP
jgi:hypothetical protein